MGDWGLYTIVGVGIAFVMWIFGSEQKDNDRETARVPVYSHDPAGTHRVGERPGAHEAFGRDRFHR